jgi:hypothetical protein
MLDTAQRQIRNPSDGDLMNRSKSFQGIGGSAARQKTLKPTKNMARNFLRLRDFYRRSGADR